MTDVLEVVLELELLRDDLMQCPLEEASPNQLLTLLGLLASTMVTILKDTISKDCLATLEQISSGDMTSTNT